MATDVQNKLDDICERLETFLMETMLPKLVEQTTTALTSTLGKVLEEVVPNLSTKTQETTTKANAPPQEQNVMIITANHRQQFQKFREAHGHDIDQQLEKREYLYYVYKRYDTFTRIYDCLLYTSDAADE